jgi:hypothetical protein
MNPSTRAIPPVLLFLVPLYAAYVIYLALLRAQQIHPHPMNALKAQTKTRLLSLLAIAIFGFLSTITAALGLAATYVAAVRKGEAVVGLLLRFLCS